jgi:hemolysin activation/secretion protein
MTTSITVLFLSAVLQAAGDPSTLPRVQEIQVEGATVFDRDAVLGMIRLLPGEPLRREPAAIARGLQNRYHIAGYVGARVQASFADGRLRLEVDEGRLREVVIDGLSGAAARRAREATGLETGKVLRETEIWSALARVERESGGALRTVPGKPYTVEPVEDGARVVLHLRASHLMALFRTWGPRTSGRHNRVDGFSLGLATELEVVDASSYNHLRLLARGAYGFSSHELRYTLGVERPFGRAQRHTLGYEFHDLTDSEDFFRRYGLEELPGGSYNIRSHSDYFRRLGHDAYAFTSLGPRAEVGLVFRSDGHTSLPVETGSDEPNPPVSEGRIHSLIGAVRFVSRGPLYPNRRVQRESFLLPSLYQSLGAKPDEWRLEATYEAARPGLGSDFDFRRLIGRARYHRRVADRHLLDALALVGLGSGDLPVQKRFYLGGLGTLRGFDRKERSGDNMLLVSAEWSWLPPPRLLPSLIPFYDGGRVWGEALPNDRWKHDAGLALRWPRSGGIFARLDAALPLNPEAGQTRKVRWNLHLHYPF